MKNLCFFILIFCNLVYADTIYLKDGSTMEGEIVERTEEYIKIKMPVGTPTITGSGGGYLVEIIPMDKILTFKTTAQIMEDEGKFEEYQKAKGLIKINNKWISQEKLKELKEEEEEQRKKQAEERMKRMGFIQHGDRWYTPEYIEAIEKAKTQHEELIRDAEKLNSGLIKTADDKWFTIEEIFMNTLSEAEIKAKQIKDKNAFFLNKITATLNIIDIAIHSCQDVNKTATVFDMIDMAQALDLAKYETWRAGKLTVESLGTSKVDKNLILDKTGYGNLIKNYGTLIERLFKECTNYPQKHKEIYDCTLEIYLNYKLYQSYFLSPHIVLDENQQKISEILEKIIKYYERIKVLFPDSGYIINIPSIKTISQEDNIKIITKEIEARTNLMKIMTAELDILGALSVALSLYSLDNDMYPSTEQGIFALIVKPFSYPTPKNWNGPYLKKHPIDPWGKAYQYISPGIHNSDYDLYSCGPDGIDGTADDIYI